MRRSCVAPLRSRGAETNIMSIVLTVRGHRFYHAGKVLRCAIGRGGFAPVGGKREGDGCTPQGVFALRECWVRSDRLNMPSTALPKRIISPADGWCDDPAHPSYNHHVSLPFPACHEKLWRDDGVYDLMVPLGYNDDHVIAGAGSAIFMHIAKPDYAPTEGCIALSEPDLLEVLSQCSTATLIDIRAE